MRAGVIGLGVIGGGVATCLARSGQLAAVHDVRPDAAAAFYNAAAVPETPAAVAAACDVVLIAVVTAEQARNVLGGPSGLLAAARPGLRCAVLSTLALEDLAALQALAQAAGVPLIDSPVTGGLHAANRGLVSMVGADQPDFDAVLPILDGYSRKVIHAGEPGKGMVTKLALNTIQYAMFAAAHDAARLAAGAEVKVAILAETIEAVGGTFSNPGIFLTRADPAVDPAERMFRKSVLTLMEKDLDAALSLARAMDVRLPLAEIVRRDGPEILGLNAMVERAGKL